MFALAPIVLAATILSGDGEEREGCRWTVAESVDFRSLCIANGNEKRTGEGVACRWSVLHEGTPFAAGAFDLKGLKPGESHTYTAPKALERARELGGSVALRLRFMEGETVLAKRQIDLLAPKGGRRWNAAPTSEVLPEVEVTDGTRRIVFKAGKYVYVFSRLTGLVERARCDGWLSNDHVVDLPMTLAVFGDGDEVFSYTVEHVSAILTVPEGARFSTVTLMASPKGTRAMFTAEWTICRDGSLVCQGRVRPKRGCALDPNTGICLTFGDADREISYFATDPLLGRYAAEAGNLAKRTRPITGVRAADIGIGPSGVGLGAVGQAIRMAVGVRNGRMRLYLIPELEEGDPTRSRALGFIIGPRRFANVVEFN